MLRLCFGVLGRVLRECKLKQGVSDVVLIGELTKTIDPMCEYQKSDGTAISKLLSCSQNLSNGHARRVGQKHATDTSDFETGFLTNRLSNVVAAAQTADRHEVARKIADNVLPLLDRDRKKVIVPALYDIISSDTVIDSEKSSSFEEYVGMRKSQLLAKHEKIVLPDLIAGLLIYTVVAVENKDGEDCAKKIDRAYVDRFIQSIDDFDVTDVLMPQVDEDESGIPDAEAISLYLEKLRTKYDKVYMLINKFEAVPFYSIFVCNDFVRQLPAQNANKDSPQKELIHDATAVDLCGISKYLIVTGTGGIGKSMMMRHLLFDAIARYDETGIFPIFVLLKDFEDNGGTMLDYISDIVANFGTGITRNKLISMLEAGKCLLIFDGLDEISKEVSDKFTKLLEAFVDRFTDNQFIISTRPNKRIAPYLRFVPLFIQPFTKNQALALIDKISFRQDNQRIKDGFRQELDQRLFRTHREFAENPLLLTIMLMTYEKYEDIPSKMHVFYKKAYEALVQEHDLNKGYNRPLATELSADDFAAYLSEFCALSYCDENFKPTREQVHGYFGMMSIFGRRNDPKMTVANFLEDMTDNLCMMYLEDEKYRFMHRSFQEYFCARCFSNQLDEDLLEIGDIFDRMRSRSYADKTFPMLYDMIPEQIRAYMFIPFLQRLFKECDEGDGYWTFLSNLYPYIEYEKGEVDEYHENPPSSYIYEFIRDEFFDEPIDLSMLPMEESLIIDRYAYIDGRDGMICLMRIADLPSDYEEMNGKPEEVGWRFELDIDKVMSRKYRYKELISVLEADDFYLKREYIRARECLDNLLANKRPQGHSILQRLI